VKARIFRFSSIFVFFVVQSKIGSTTKCADAGLFTSKSKSKSIRRVTNDRFRVTAESALRLLTTLPLLTRDKDTAAALPRRELLLLISAARQCPMLRNGPGEVALGIPPPLFPMTPTVARRV